MMRKEELWCTEVQHDGLYVQYKQIKIKLYEQIKMKLYEQINMKSTCYHLFSYSSAEIRDSVSMSVYSKATVLLFPLPTTHRVKSVHSFASWCLWISASFIIGLRLIRSIFFDSEMYIAYHIRRSNVIVIIDHHRRLLIGQPSWSWYL